jgi:hypothetical protein
MGLLSTVEATLPNGFHDADIVGFSRDNARLVITFRPWLGDDTHGAPIDLCLSGWHEMSANFDDYVRAVGTDTWFDIVESNQGDIEVFCGRIGDPLVIRSVGSVSKGQDAP